MPHLRDKDLDHVRSYVQLYLIEAPSLGWALKAHLRGQTNENLKGRAEVGMLSTRRTKGWHGQAPDAVARAWYEGDPVSRARTDLLRQIPLRPQMPGFNKGCG